MKGFFSLFRKKVTQQQRHQEKHPTVPKPFRRVAFGLLGILGILLGAALVLPLFLNVNSYKPQIVAKAREALGRDVHIDGKLSLSLFPSPQVSMEQVSIANLAEGSRRDLVRIKNLTISASLLPLLKKQIKIKAIDIYSPEIFLEKLADGRVNWAFSPSSPSSSSPDIALDKVAIHNGHLVYHEKAYHEKSMGKDVEIQEINVSGQVASLQGPYALAGTLKALGQQIRLDTTLAAPATPEKLQGVSLKVQVGDITSTVEGQASLSPLTFKGTLEALADLKAFASSEGKASPLLSNPLRINAAVMANETAISFTQATVQVGSARPTGSLKVHLKEALKAEGTLKDMPGQGECVFTAAASPQGLAGSLNVTVAKSKEFLEWLTVDTKTMPSGVLGGIAFSGNYTLGDIIRLQNLNLKVKEANLRGDTSWHWQKDGPLVAIDLESPKVEAILRLLGVQDPKPLGTGKLKANIQWNATSLHLTRLKGQMGNRLSFAGDIAVDQAGAKPKVKATLAFNSIAVDTLLASHQAADSPYPEGKIFLISRRPRSRASAGAPWPRDPLDFSFLNKFDGQFEISASELRQKDWVVSRPKMIAVVQKGRLDISALTGHLFEGSLIGKGHVTSGNALRVHLTLNEANLRNLPARGANVKIVGGKLFCSTDLSTHGASVDDMVKNLHGPVNITAANGVINGFDLRTLSRRLGSLQNPASLLGLLTTSMGQGQTPFSSFNGNIVFKDGIGTIQSMNLVAPDGQGHASGQIDLPRYLLNIQAQFRLINYPKIPPFHMQLSGPINNPSRKLDTSALQKYMMEAVFSGALENLGKLKPNLNKPEQMVKDIFKGIF